MVIGLIWVLLRMNSLKVVVHHTTVGASSAEHLGTSGTCMMQTPQTDLWDYVDQTMHRSPRRMRYGLESSSWS